MLVNLWSIVNSLSAYVGVLTILWPRGTPLKTSRTFPHPSRASANDTRPCLISPEQYQIRLTEPALEIRPHDCATLMRCQKSRCTLQFVDIAHSIRVHSLRARNLEDLQAHARTCTSKDKMNKRTFGFIVQDEAIHDLIEWLLIDSGSALRARVIAPKFVIFNSPRLRHHPLTHSHSLWPTRTKMSRTWGRKTRRSMIPPKKRKTSAFLTS